MSTAIITRFHYPKGHPKFKWRFDYYAREVLPRIFQQTDQNFEIWIWCEPHHDKLFRLLSPRINIFHATYQPRKSRFFIDFTPFENTDGLPKFNVQVGLDSDELIEPDYIEKIHEHCTGNQKKCIMFQGLLLDVRTGKKYHMRRTYGEHFGSAMFAFYQPDIVDDYFFILQTSGHRAPKFAEKVIVVPEGYVLVSVHGHNDSTSLHRHAKGYV